MAVPRRSEHTAVQRPQCQGEVHGRSLVAAAGQNCRVQWGSTRAGPCTNWGGGTLDGNDSRVVDVVRATTTPRAHYRNGHTQDADLPDRCPQTCGGLSARVGEPGFYGESPGVSPCQLDACQLSC
jgi:hypothetical protein